MNILLVLSCSLPLVKSEQSQLQRVAVDVQSVPINTNPEIKALPPSPEGGPSVMWLGCLHLKPRDPNSLFGGISGSYMHGSRLFMLSDTTKWGGSGRFFTGDLKMGPSDVLNGEFIVPVDLQNVTTQPLKDESGNLLTDSKEDGERQSWIIRHPDTESLGIRWPGNSNSQAEVLIGVERKHKVRIYEVGSASSEDPVESIGDVTPSLMKDAGGKHNVGIQLRRCTRGEGNLANNFGAEGTAFVSDTEFVVFCEYNKPDGPDSITVGWVAEYKTGAIKASLELPLPRVPDPGLEGERMRISSVVAVPGTRDVMFLFHYWGPSCKSIIQIARATLPAEDGDLSPKRLDPKVVLGPLKEKEGYPVDNFETMNVAPTKTPGVYTIHIISDNNFNDQYQKTYLLSMLMNDDPKTQRDPVSSQTQTRMIASAAMLAAVAAVLGLWAWRIRALATVSPLSSWEE